MEDTLRACMAIRTQEWLCLNPCFNGRYSQRAKQLGNHRVRIVLILVLMEDTLRVCEQQFGDVTGLPAVLILVLMEDTLRDSGNISISTLCGVLILVLMEDTLRDLEQKSFLMFIVGLNPCFNGRYSQSLKVTVG